MSHTKIEINMSQLIANLQAIRCHLDAVRSGIKLCLPIKDNAYGHGMLAIAKHITHYVDYFAISDVSEAQEMHNSGIDLTNIRVLMFGVCDNASIVTAINLGVELTISSYDTLMEIVNCCNHNSNIQVCKIHLKIETGMQRLGITPETLDLVTGIIDTIPQIRVCGVYSHFACSDEGDKTCTMLQLHKFKECERSLRIKYPDAIYHIANSGAIGTLPESYCDMVRPGIMSYGYIPNVSMPCDIALLTNIKPCLSLKSRVVQVSDVATGIGISYGYRYVTPCDTKIATIAIGYGDGVKRSLSNVGHVLIRGQRYPIAGTICMDMLMVDVGADALVACGDEVVLIGAQGGCNLSTIEVATLCNTITYEILTSLSSKIPRIITDNFS